MRIVIITGASSGLEQDTEFIQIARNTINPQSSESEKIICYNEPFPKMQGDIVFVDYDGISWKYIDKGSYIPSKIRNTSVEKNLFR